MEYTGIVKVKMDTIKVSEKFKKRDFVLRNEEEQYPQLISFQLNQDRCDIIDPINIGDKVAVKFGLQGRAWKKDDSSETKCFNQLVAFSVVKISAQEKPDF